MAEDAREAAIDRGRMMRRVTKHASRNLVDVRDAAALRVRHSPLKAVGAAAGLTLILGALAGFVIGRKR